MSVCNRNEDGSYNVNIDGSGDDSLGNMIHMTIPLGLRLTWISTLVLHHVHCKKLPGVILEMTELKALHISTEREILRLPNNMTILKNLDTFTCGAFVEPKWICPYGASSSNYILTQNVLQRLHEYQTYTGAVYEILEVAPFSRDIRKMICAEILESLVRPRHICYTGLAPTISFIQLPIPHTDILETKYGWLKIIFAENAILAMNVLNGLRTNLYEWAVDRNTFYVLLNKLRNYYEKHCKGIILSTINDYLLLYVCNGEFATANEFLRRCFLLLRGGKDEQAYTCCGSRILYCNNIVTRDYYLYSDVCNFTL